MQLTECIDMKAPETSFVGYSYKREILQEMVFYVLPEGHSTQEHIFNIVDETGKANHLLLYNCISICADGVTAMTC